MDAGTERHARILCDYSLGIQKGDMLLIKIDDLPGMKLAEAVTKECGRIGARALIYPDTTGSYIGFMKNASEETAGRVPRHLEAAARNCDAYLQILSQSRGFGTYAFGKKDASASKAMQPVAEELRKKRYTVTLHPTKYYASKAGMGMDEYREFCYDAIIRDWQKEIGNMNTIKRILDQENEVTITGDRTDICMSIRGRTGAVSDGRKNMPGGEAYTSPVEESVCGKAYFDMGSGIIKGAFLEFERGILVDYSAEKNQDYLRSLIETDEGSGKIGEIGIGTNRGIGRATDNVLFDEKIAGTVHLALGSSFDACGGTNQSAIHKDLIKTMKTGEIIAGDTTILKDGKLIFEK